MLVLSLGFLYHTVDAKNVQANTGKSSTLLADSFHTTGADFKKMDIKGWAQLNDSYITPNEIHKKLSLVSAQLGIDTKKLKTQIQSSNNYFSISKSGWFDRQTYLTVIVQTTRENNKLAGGQNKGETYLIVGFSHFGAPKNYLYLRTKILGAFYPGQAEANYSTVISGTLPKKIDVTEMQKLTKKAMETAGASNLENAVDARMVSVTGYTPGIVERLTLGQKTVNINMAVRYNSEDNNTYVYIGSPIITTEY